jgi:hypothetical protein
MISMISPSRAAKRLLIAGLTLSTVLTIAVNGAHAQAVAVPPYVLTGFIGVPPTGATQPDDLAVSADGANLWIGYGNGACTFGPGGIPTSCPAGTPTNSNLVEYSLSTRTALLNISIPGHLDGLKINPTTGDVWATENEDGNPTLTIIKAKTGKFKTYTFDPTLVTGGMDDLVFSGTKSKSVFIVTSSQTSTSSPVIVQIAAKSGKSSKTNTKLTSTLVGDPGTVWNVVTNSAETGDMIGDPDSMTLDPAGELVLDNRSDKSLYVARAPTVTNAVLRVPLTDKTTGLPVEVNDTIFTTSATSLVSSTAGTIFITDTSTNTIYTLVKPYFPANEVYTAENVAGVVGLVDMNTGVVTPVVTGLTGPHGLAFSANAVAIAP